MAEDKELLKKDIVKIIKIDSMMHYENIEEVKRIHGEVVEQKMFSTFIGQRYIKKLEQVLQSNHFSCFFCDNEIADKKLICNECLSKLHVKKVQPLQEITPEENPAQESPLQESVTQENDTQETVVLEETIEEIKAADIKKTFDFKESRNGLSKTVKRVFIAAFLVCAIIIVGVCINKNDSSESAYSVEISSIDDALSVMESIFPSEEYTLKFQQQLYPAEEMFKVEIGEYCGETWSNKKTIDAYLFTVQSIETPHYSCMCYVSIDGRVIGYGNLIYEADTSAFFRLK